MWDSYHKSEALDEFEKSLASLATEEELAASAAQTSQRYYTEFPRPEFTHYNDRPKYRANHSLLSAPVVNNGLVVETPLQPWAGPLRGRLDRQATEVRNRLEDPSAVMIVKRGRVYSAKSFLGVIWLYLMTLFFGPPKPKKEKKKQDGKGQKR